MELRDEIRQCIALLANGKVEEAQRFAEVAVGQLRQELQVIETEIALLNEVLSQVPITEVTQEEPEAGTPRFRRGGAERAADRIAVLEAADKIYPTSSPQLITTDGVYAYMKNLGQIPPSKTGIGLIINSAKGWKRIDRGVYQKFSDGVEPKTNAVLPPAEFRLEEDGRREVGNVPS